MSPAYPPEVRAERDRRLLQLAGEGLSLNGIAAEMGVTRQAVHQRLKRLGHAIGDFPRARERGACAFCGAPLRYARAATKYGLHVCVRRACAGPYRREVNRRTRALALARRDSADGEGREGAG